MKLEEVKKIINLKQIAEVAENTEMEGYFEEDSELLVTELSSKVYRASRNNELDYDAIDYLDKLKEVIRKELINTIKNLKNKNLEV